MQRFYTDHPEWAKSAPPGPEFHHKWNFAFHQNGDAGEAERVRCD